MLAAGSYLISQIRDGNVIIINVFWNTVAKFPGSGVHSYLFGFVHQMGIDRFGLLSYTPDLF